MPGVSFPMCPDCAKPFPALLFTFIGNGDMLAVSYCEIEDEFFFSQLDASDIVHTIQTFAEAGIMEAGQITKQLVEIAQQYYPNINAIKSADVQKFIDQIQDGVAWDELEEE